MGNKKKQLVDGGKQEREKLLSDLSFTSGKVSPFDCNDNVQKDFEKAMDKVNIWEGAPTPTPPENETFSSGHPYVSGYFVKLYQWVINIFKKG